MVQICQAPPSFNFIKEILESPTYYNTTYLEVQKSGGGNMQLAMYGCAGGGLVSSSILD